MKFVWLGCFLWSGLLIAGNQQAEYNVNSRYTVESVEIHCHDQSKISSSLRKEVNGLVGEKFNPDALNEAAKRIRKELHARAVTQRVLRGTVPNHVRVVFEVKEQPVNFDLSIPKFLYNSKQGWSAAVDATTTIAGNAFTLGLVSDNDELPERYTGVVARYENRKVGTDRLWLRFSFGSYHEQWNRATQVALAEVNSGPEGAVPGIYRTRQSFEPVATIVLARPLSVSVGTNFERFQTQFPVAHTQAANALIGTIRYHRQLEDSYAGTHDLDALYSVRAATRILESDFVYVRHRAEIKYVFTRGHHVLMDEAMAGLISGQAPLFERFVLGNSSTLRGWNRFDIDPLGGDRMAHNTLDYRYRFFEIFYDAGAVWSRNQDAIARHSLGLGLRQGVFSLAVAFPVKDGRAEPIFMVGMNY